MKKILIGLIAVILMGAAVSTLERFVGVNLYSWYQAVVIVCVFYMIANESRKTKKNSN